MIYSDKMKEEVTDQVKKNLEYWKAEIPKEVYINLFLGFNSMTGNWRK